METYPGYREPPPLTQPPKKKSTYATIAALLVVVIFVGAVAIYWALLPARATVTVQIVNTADVTVSFDLSMDGEFLLFGYIRANEYVGERFSIILDSGACEEHTFSVVFSGPMVGGYVHSETVTLCPGADIWLSLGA
jgi:hypothetical protein